MSRTWSVLLSAALGAVPVLACVDLSNLSGGADAPCPVGQERVGALCVAPSPGDPNGACAKAGLLCGAHGKCDESGGAAKCLCATGYARVGEACEWRGGPANPGFTTTEAWQLAGGAVIQTESAGSVEPGVLAFDGDAACVYGETAKQSFAMPAFADAEPFALEVTGTSVKPLLSPLLGGAPLADAAFPIGAFGRKSLCLGEKAYGGNVELVLATSSFDSCESQAVSVDRAAIVPAPQCPAPGTIPNGDFEGTGVWQVGGNGGLAEVATGVGSKGGRAGRLATSGNCHGPTLEGALSSPAASMPRASLGFSFKGTANEDMPIRVGGELLGAVRGGATFEAARFCVPEYAKGTVLPIQFALIAPGGTCATPYVRDFVFDDLAFSPDPACPERAFVIDGGFEREASSSAQWVLSHSTQFSTAAEIVATDPHGGAAALRLAIGQVCQNASAAQTLTVPPPVGASGPAIKFFYKVPSGTRATFGTTPGAKLPLATTWTAATVCLDPRLAGRAQPFTIFGQGGPGTCADTFVQEELFVDDVEVTTDAACLAVVP